MRNLVQPPPSVHCELCGGELRLKLIEASNDPLLDSDVEIFVCAKCGHEQSFVVGHNHYAFGLRDQSPRKFCMSTIGVIQWCLAPRPRGWRNIARQRGLRLRRLRTIQALIASSSGM